MPSYKVTLPVVRRVLVRRTVNVANADNSDHAIAIARRGHGAIVSEDAVREDFITRGEELTAILDYLPAAHATELRS